MTPENALVGKIVYVNTPGMFAVMTFPVGHMPVIGQRMNVYRSGLKVGEVKVSGPQYDENIVGDIVTGESQAGDEVRTN